MCILYVYYSTVNVLYICMQFPLHINMYIYMYLCNTTGQVSLSISLMWDGRLRLGPSCLKPALQVDPISSFPELRVVFFQRAWATVF